MSYNRQRPDIEDAMLFLTEWQTVVKECLTRKWTGRRQDWSAIHAQLAVYFADRMPG